MRQSLTIAIVLLLVFLRNVESLLEVYEGIYPIESTSPIFTIKLSPNYNSKIYLPHVYYTKVNNSNYDADISHLQPAFYNRSVSFIEFGQQSNDTTLITVTLNDKYSNLFNINSNNIQILPSIYNINTNLIKNNNTNQIESVSFNVTNNFKSLSLEYGHICNLTLNHSALCLNSSFKDSLLIFIGDLSPSKPNRNNSNIIYFTAGVHNATNNNSGNGGILKTNVSEIYFERGAFVYGKIECLTNNNNDDCNIIGYGMLCGSRFNHADRRSNPVDSQRMITTSNRALNLFGTTIIDPSGWSIVNVPRYSRLESYKLIGWYYNNDGIGFEGDSILLNSFIRTNDDSIKLQYGSNNTVESCTIWQLFNGGCIQFGWGGNGCIDCLINNTNILHTEWRGNYLGDTSNDAVIDLNTPYLDSNQYLKRIYKNISILNTNVDTNIGRFFGIRFYNISEDTYVELSGMKIKNVNINTNQHWFVSEGYGPLFMNISNCSSLNNSNVYSMINNIQFDNVYMNGKHIMNNSDWNMEIFTTYNNSIQNITYF